MANPFQQGMTKMKLPEDGGTHISVGGFTLEADEDGCVEVPSTYITELQAHGLTIHGAAKAPVEDKPAKTKAGK